METLAPLGPSTVSVPVCASGVAIGSAAGRSAGAAATGAADDAPPIEMASTSARMVAAAPAATRPARGVSSLRLARASNSPSRNDGTENDGAEIDGAGGRGGAAPYGTGGSSATSFHDSSSLANGAVGR